MAAMKAHRNSEEVQHDGCSVLSNMSEEWEEYRPLIVVAGGASAITFVIETYRADPESLEEAYDALDKLVQRPR
jgi:hypothetical protein